MKPEEIGFQLDLLSHFSSDQIGLVTGDTSYSFACLDGLVKEREAWFKSIGVEPYDLAVVIGENGLSMWVSMVALVRLGACISPLNARLSAREIHEILNIAKPKIEVYCGGSEANVRHAALRQTALIPGNLVGGDRFHIEGIPKEHTFPKDRLQYGVILYTSGTSGTPKGVVWSRSFFAGLGKSFAERAGLGKEDCMLAVAPFSHGLGLSSMFAALLAGTSLYIMPRFDPDRAAALIISGKISVITGVPLLFRKLADAMKGGLPEDADISIKSMTSGGAPLTLELKKLVEKVFSITLNNGYGLTECTPISSTLGTKTPSFDPKSGVLSVGKVIEPLKVRIEKQGQVLFHYEVGEIVVENHCGFLGYLGDEIATIDMFASDGALKTGDLGYLNEDGELFIVGRSKDVIIRSGFNIYPGEVEAVLQSHSAVRAAAVIADVIDGEERLIAFVELCPGHEASAEEILAHTADKLAPYKKPESLHFMNKLPRSQNGKILKRDLKAISL